jgi:Tfp pilus assembly protein PilN
MRAVNLLPKDQARRTRTKTEQKVIFAGSGGFVLVTAILALMFLGASGKVHAEKSKLADATAVLAALPAPPAGPTEAQTKLTSEQQPRLAAVRSAFDQRIAWDRVLREVSLVLPDDVWLASMTAKAPDPAQAAATAPGTPVVASGLMMTGNTYSHAAVARFLSRLQVIPDLDNVQLQNSQLTRAAGRELVNFTILADVRGSEKAQ